MKTDYSISFIHKKAFAAHPSLSKRLKTHPIPRILATPTFLQVDIYIFLTFSTLFYFLFLSIQREDVLFYAIETDVKDLVM